MNPRATAVIAWLRQRPQRLLMGSVRAYQLFLSSWLGASCRFEPTCSAYALQALSAHGAAAGTYLTLRRIARCGPWCAGGHDAVPGAPPRLFGTRPEFISGETSRADSASSLSSSSSTS